MTQYVIVMPSMLKHRFLPLVIGIAALGLTACSSTPPKHENPAISQLLDRDVGELNAALAAKIMAEPHAVHSSTRQKVEGEINRRVWWWLRYYSVRDRERFNRVLERGETYRVLVQQILSERQLPTELYYLAMIESGYVNNARSSASAVGIWQFMRPTAINYGLMEHGIDERRHPIAATLAAARYLSDLHRQFNSWYLAIAAYNAGQGRIRQAIREGHTRDFWKLADEGYLPQETMDYIPKFLAAATIGGHLEHFGFQPPIPQQQWPQIAAVDLNPGMKLSTIARLAALSEKDLLRLNPQLNQQLHYRRRIRIWVPRDTATRFSAKKGTVVAQRE